MLDIFVEVEYEYRRLKRLLEMDKKDVALEVRQDFTLLKLPHPPERNIRDPTADGILVSWMTKKDSSLHYAVTKIVKEQDTNDILIDAKIVCCIKTLSYREVRLSGGQVRQREEEKRTLALQDRARILGVRKPSLETYRRSPGYGRTPGYRKSRSPERTPERGDHEDSRKRRKRELVHSCERRSRSYERAQGRGKQEDSVKREKRNPAAPSHSSPIRTRRTSLGDLRRSSEPERPRKGKTRELSPERPELDSGVPRALRSPAVNRIDIVMKSLKDIHASLEDSKEEPSSGSGGSQMDPLLDIPPRPLGFKHAIPQKPKVGVRIMLEDDLFETRQELTTLVLRAAALEEQLKRLSSPIEMGEPGHDIRAQLVKAKTDLILERQARRQAELFLSDVKQECDARWSFQDSLPV